VTPEEAHAFRDYFDGGAAVGPGLLNRALELDTREVHDGTNVLELTGAGPGVGGYKMSLIGVDPLLPPAACDWACDPRVPPATARMNRKSRIHWRLVPYVG
jgi:hypothetical protein